MEDGYDVHPPRNTSVAYRKVNGDTGYVTGLEVNLGEGVVSKLPAYGLRRSLWHFSFGYVSGFPVKDILSWLLVYSVSPRLKHYFLSKEGVECGGQGNDMTGSTDWCKLCYSPEEIAGYNSALVEGGYY